MMFLTRGDNFGSRSSCHPTLARRFSFFSLWTCRWIQDVTIIAWAARTLSQSLLFLFVFSLPLPCDSLPNELARRFWVPLFGVETFPRLVLHFVWRCLRCLLALFSILYHWLRNFSW
jgi:hypothetical protein